MKGQFGMALKEVTTMMASETAGRIHVLVDPRPFQLALGLPLRAAAFVLTVGLLIPKSFHRFV
jgi:hypothetical protein